MQNTYKNFSKLTRGYDALQTVEEVALYCQNNTDNTIEFAFIFCKLYPFMKRKTDKLFFMSEEDKSSICIEELQKVIRDFQGYGKIITMLGKYLDGRYLAEVNLANRDVRKANYDSSSYEAMLEDSHNDRYSATCAELESVEFAETLENLGTLTPSELSFCRIRMKYDKSCLSDSDIASMLSITSSAVTQIKKSLKVKLVAFA